MEKFNLERALAGEPVCTRDGRDVTQLVKFDIDSDYQIWGVINQFMYGWDLDGKNSNLKDTPTDLFMKPKENAIWVNVYKSVKGFLFLGHQFDTEEEAIDDAKGESIFVKRLRITDKPDTI